MFIEYTPLVQVIYYPNPQYSELFSKECRMADTVQ